MTQAEFQQSVLDQLTLLTSGQHRLEERIGRMEGLMGSLGERMDGLEGRMGNLEERLDGLEERMEAGFTDLKALLGEVFGSPIAEGVELYTDRRIREHEERCHPDLATAA